MGGTCETRCGRQSGHEECLSICMTVMWCFKFSCVKTMCNYNTDGYGHCVFKHTCFTSVIATKLLLLQ